MFNFEKAPLESPAKFKTKLKFFFSFLLISFLLETFIFKYFTTFIVLNFFGAFLEIEVREEKEALTAAAIWNQQEVEDKPKLVIMLDNFGPERSKDVASQITEMGLRECVILEASGGIIFENLTDWYECGLDVLSTSALNRGVPPMDLSMLLN